MVVEVVTHFETERGGGNDEQNIINKGETRST